MDKYVDSAFVPPPREGGPQWQILAQQQTRTGSSRPEPAISAALNRHARLPPATRSRWSNSVVYTGPPQPTFADVMKAIQDLANKSSQLSKNSTGDRNEASVNDQRTRRDRRQHGCGRGLAAVLGGLHREEHVDGRVKLVLARRHARAPLEVREQPRPLAGGSAAIYSGGSGAGGDHGVSWLKSHATSCALQVPFAQPRAAPSGASVARRGFMSFSSATST